MKKIEFESEEQYRNFLEDIFNNYIEVNQINRNGFIDGAVVYGEKYIKKSDLEIAIERWTEDCEDWGVAQLRVKSKKIFNLYEKEIERLKKLL